MGARAWDSLEFGNLLHSLQKKRRKIDRYEMHAPHVSISTSYLFVTEDRMSQRLFVYFLSNIFELK